MLLSVLFSSHSSTLLYLSVHSAHPRLQESRFPHYSVCKLFPCLFVHLSLSLLFVAILFLFKNMIQQQRTLPTFTYVLPQKNRTSRKGKNVSDGNDDHLFWFSCLSHLFFLFLMYHHSFLFFAFSERVRFSLSLSLFTPGTQVVMTKNKKFPFEELKWGGRKKDWYSMYIWSATSL